MTNHCYNETCENELVENHTSWFCSEECRSAYWAFLKTKRPRTIKDMQEWCQKMKQYCLEHQEEICNRP